jgi:nucleoside-diphosphate-sugar epimerase
MLKLLVTGAAGNLGELLAFHLVKNPAISLRLMYHQKSINQDLIADHSIEKAQADLGKIDTLLPALSQVDVIIHFAGVLFKHHPERFLHTTNKIYFSNLLEAARIQNVKKVILISFPHVEGESTPEHPAIGRLDQFPRSVHAQTRLQEEIALFKAQQNSSINAVSLRVGMVYGKGILMIEGARWFAQHGLLGIWKKPTYIHLISVPDFLKASEAAIINDGTQGIYHMGDDGRQTLQEFLDDACRHWGYRKPLRMPVWLIVAAAWHFEMISWIFGIKSPLTRDFIKIGRVSYYGDTR